MDPGEMGHIQRKHFHSNLHDKKYKISNDTTIPQSRIYPSQELKEPKDFDDIFNFPDKKEWMDAVKNELKYEKIKCIPNS